VLQYRAASGQHSAFPIFVRVARADPAELGRYEAEGFEHVLVWADQLWPREGDLEHKRQSLRSAAEELGIDNS
jgi:hypothetical protein